MPYIPGIMNIKYFDFALFNMPIKKQGIENNIVINNKPINWPEKYFLNIS